MITVIPRKITATSVNGVAVTNDGNIDIRMPLSVVQEILGSDADNLLLPAEGVDF